MGPQERNDSTSQRQWFQLVRSKPVASQMTHDTDYYVKCMFGGVLSCGPTHTAFTPLDVAKCNMQTNPRKYKGLIGSLTTIVREEGLGSAWKGWLPTLLGYSAQVRFRFVWTVFPSFYAPVPRGAFVLQYFHTDSC